MKKYIVRKDWIVVIILLLVVINIGPIVNANFCRIKPMTYIEGDNIEEDLMKVTCQFSTFRGISKVDKMIPLKTVEKISILAQNIYSALTTNLHPKIIKERIITLVDELKNNEILPSIINSKKVVTLLMNYLTISQKLSILFQDDKIKADDNSTLNKLAFVFAFGQNAECSPFHRSSVINKILWFLFGKGIITIQQLLDIQYFIDHRSRIFMATGDVYFHHNGSAATIGLSGLYNMKDDRLMLVLFGFIGLVLISEKNGLVLGFTLQTFMF